MTSDNAKDNSGIRGRTHSDLYLACGSLMFIILLIDLSIPLGAAMGVPYIIVILISLWSPHKANTVLLAAICSAFTIGVFFYQPAVAEMWKVVFNRFITVFAIWATAFVGLQWKTAEQNREKAIHDRENT